MPRSDRAPGAREPARRPRFCGAGGRSITRALAADDSAVRDRSDGLLTLLEPASQRLPLLVSSPHSGRDYPDNFIATSVLDLATLRRSEDCFVEELFGWAPALGVPILAARFPRAYVDCNRAPFELDPAMFDGPLPSYAQSASPRARAGLGTIARVVTNEIAIYGRKLSVEEGLARIGRCYWPYHKALQRLLEQTQQRFGLAVLLDCHSMPARFAPGDPRPAADVVLGDGHGSTCDGALIETAAAVLRRQGYSVRLNRPYAGGFITRHYGRPESGLHALQIELSRDLYMAEARYQRLPAFDRVAEDMRTLAIALAESAQDLSDPLARAAE